MPRNVSLPMMRAMLSQTTDELPLTILVIDHDTLDEPIRLVADTANLTRSDGVYIALPFQINLPLDSGDQIPSVQLVVDNIDPQRALALAVQEMTSPATITLSVVLRSSPNTIEAGPYAFRMESVVRTVETITISLSQQNFMQEPFPSGAFSPALYPGLFKT